MNLGNWWRKYRDWIIVLIIVSIISVSTVWVLQLFPQYLFRFAFAPLIALFLIALLASNRRYRVRLHELLMEYYAKVQKRGGLLYRYGRPLNAFIITILLALLLVLYYNPEFLGMLYIPHLIFAFFIAFLISWIVFIAGFLRATGKWGLLLIIILTVLAALRILLWQLSR